MKYILLLRGINVGGNSIIKMADLKDTIEKCGYNNVKTYIQSGNVIFDSDEQDTNKIAAKLDNALSKAYNLDSRLILRNYQQLKEVVANIPDDWKTRNDLRRYIAFLRAPVTAKEALREIELKQGVDFIKTGDGVLYLSTVLSGLTKSGFTKLIAKKVYKDITMRNFNTVQEILTMME